MQEITVPKQPSIAGQVVALPIGSLVVVLRPAHMNPPDRPYDTILRISDNGWAMSRGNTTLTRVELIEEIDSLVFEEFRLFELYHPAFGWLLEEPGR